MNLNKNECAIILASLRLGQKDILTLAEMPQLKDEGIDVDDADIDRLCEKINLE